MSRVSSGTALVGQRIGVAIMIAALIAACGSQTTKSADSHQPRVRAYKLFQAGSEAVPNDLRPHVSGVVRVLDTRQQHVSAVAVLNGYSEGTEVCVLVAPRLGAPRSQLSGACNGPSGTATTEPWLAAFTARDGVSSIAGLVPNGISSLTVKMRGGRRVALTVRRNSVALRTSGDVTAFCWSQSGRTRCRSF